MDKNCTIKDTNKDCLHVTMWCNYITLQDGIDSHVVLQAYATMMTQQSIVTMYNNTVIYGLIYVPSMAGIN